MNIIYHYLEETDSTNDRLKVMAESDAVEGTVLSAGRQIAGRGRRGHNWESPAGDSISTSMLLLPTDLTDEDIMILTPMAAVCVSLAIEALYELPTQIKWVNDVLLGGKKVSGILCEQMFQEDGRRAVIIGIGINVHQHAFPIEIADMATSIDAELSERQMPFSGRVARRELTECVWEKFSAIYERQKKDKTVVDEVLEEYRRRLVNIGQRCRVMDPRGEYEGEAVGIDKMGRLVIETGSGERRTIDAGEVSVRGIYGYV